MATFVHFLLLLFVASGGVPIKPKSPHEGATNACIGTECSYSYEEDTVEVSFPDNFTNAILLALPNIQESHGDMVSLMNKTLISQDIVVDKLENIVSLQNKTVENVAALMGAMVNLLQYQVPAKDCSDYVVRSRGIYKSRSYGITPPDGLEPLEVYCDFIGNEGWTVFQRRYDGSLNFYRNWAEYENGFGDLNGEFWLGLKNIYRLISDGSTWALRVDLESFDGESAYVVYDSFSISDAGSNYRLSVGEYSGTAGDALKYTGSSGTKMHNGMAFSTHDRDNDGASSSNCAANYRGAFWYNKCYRANLNARYSSLYWNTWKGFTTLKSSQMKIRRVD